MITRYEKKLPKVDVFVCTADPVIEPPIMVINTVLSVMAYDYPPENLSIYLSDDAGSELTFYALLEASIFSRNWLPFCKKFKVEPRSPAAYFESLPEISDSSHAQEFASIKVKCPNACIFVKKDVIFCAVLRVKISNLCRNYMKKWKIELKLQINLDGFLTRSYTKDLLSGILLCPEEITTPFCRYCSCFDNIFSNVPIMIRIYQSHIDGRQ